jgi:adenylate cyclase, class 2
VNDEREFTVSDATVFGDLLSRLGLAVWIRKRKIGEAWTADGVTIELSEIEGLGFFVELEILADVDDAATVAEARKRLQATLERIGIDAAKIETRYYTEMLALNAKG